MSSPAPTPKELLPTSILHSCSFWIVAILASAQAAFAWGRNMSTTWYPVYQAGMSEYPYRCRLLMVWVGHPLYRIASGMHFKLTHSPSPDATFLTNTVIFFTLMLGTIMVAKQFLSVTLGRRNPLLSFLPLLTVYMANYNLLLISENKATMPWDPASIFLFGLGCYAAYTQRRALYYISFVLACFNKESALFLPAVFFLFSLDAERPLWSAVRAKHWKDYIEIGLQLCTWKVIIRFCTVTTGPSVSFHFTRDNLHMLSNPIHWSTFASVFGFLWVPYFLFFKRIGDVRLQRVLLLSPLWVVVKIVYADVLEIRTDSEWIVYLTVCVGLILYNTLPSRATQNEQRNLQTFA